MLFPSSADRSETLSQVHQQGVQPEENALPQTDRGLRCQDCRGHKVSGEKRGLVHRGHSAGVSKGNTGPILSVCHHASWMGSGVGG